MLCEDYLFGINDSFIRNGSQLLIDKLCKGDQCFVVTTTGTLEPKDEDIIETEEEHTGY